MIMKLKKLVESTAFQNVILAVIIINSVILGLQTSQTLESSIGGLLAIIDSVCLGIFVIEMILKMIVYKIRYFTDGWNIFDFVIILMSIFSSLAFLSTFRVFRVFRVFRSLKAFKSLRSFRLLSSLKKLRVIVQAIIYSIPSLGWTMFLMVIIYYIFAIMGVSLFGQLFPDWFGTIGKTMYTLFQVMTLESWSMGISRPVMEEFSWAWIYFIPFVLITSFIVMNVVVGIVVNAISAVTEENKAEEHREMKKSMEEPELYAEVVKLRTQAEYVQNLMEKASRDKEKNKAARV